MWCESCRRHVFEHCCNHNVFCCKCYTVPFNSCFYLYIAIEKRVVLLFVNALYKFPLVLLLLIHSWVSTGWCVYSWPYPGTKARHIQLSSGLGLRASGTPLYIINFAVWNTELWYGRTADRSHVESNNDGKLLVQVWPRSRAKFGLAWAVVYLAPNNNSWCLTLSQPWRSQCCF